MVREREVKMGERLTEHSPEPKVEKDSIAKPEAVTFWCCQHP